ncbi:hypothetical protein BH11MYX2_BH11MYX2_11890 [soil metagenome]
MTFERSPYEQTNGRGSTSSAGGSPAPGKMSLTESLGSHSRQAPLNDQSSDKSADESIAAKKAADTNVYGNDTRAKEVMSVAPKPLPRLQLGKPAAAKKATPPVRSRHAAAAPAAAVAASGAPASSGKGTQKPTHGGEGHAADHGGEGKPAADAGGAKAAAPDPKANASITIEVARTASGNPSKARTSVGVGEQVTFSSNGAGDWTAGGTSFGGGSTATWTASDTAGSVEIAHKVNGSTQKQAMNVVAPSSVTFESKGGFPVATAGVGMTTKVKVGPTNVSFGACEWLEEPGGADGTSGYFDEYVKAGKGDLAHHPNKNWLGMGDSNDAVEDHAWTSDNPKLTNPATKQDGYFAGGSGWNVPKQSRVAGKGEGTAFTNVRQQFAMSADGSVSVTKGAASATQAGDGTVQGSMEKCTSVGQAHAMLNRQGSRIAATMFVLQYNASADKDPDTQKYLIEALKAENVKFYVHVHCVTTYNWFSRDKLDVSVKGPKGAHTENFLINSKKNNEFTFALTEILDYASAGIPPISIQAIDEDGKTAFKMAMPNFQSQREVDAGSNGHYTVTAALQ